MSDIQRSEATSRQPIKVNEELRFLPDEPAGAGDDDDENDEDFLENMSPEVKDQLKAQVLSPVMPLVSPVLSCSNSTQLEREEIELHFFPTSGGSS